VKLFPVIANVYVQQGCICLHFFPFFFSDFTPLHCSAQNGHLEICRLLLQSDANPQAENRL
jgi:hypothetical protein